MMFRQILPLLAIVAVTTTPGLTRGLYTLDNVAAKVETTLQSDNSIKSIKRLSDDTFEITFRNETEAQFYIGNLTAALNAAAAGEEDEIWARYLSSLYTLRDRTENFPDIDGWRSKLILIVRNKSYATAIEKMRGDQEASDENTIATRSLAADYVELFALNDPEKLSVLTLASLKKLGEDEATLRKLAYSNLTRFAEQNLEILGDGDIKMLALDGNLEASMLALPEFWNQQAETFGSPIVVIAPARDVVLFTAEANPDAVHHMINIAKKNMPSLTNQISDDPIVWRDGAWSKYKD